MDIGRARLRSALRTRNSELNVSTDNSTSSVSSTDSTAARRVTFPADNMLVTSYLQPPNPWEKAINSSPTELVNAYKESCEKQCVKPLPKVIQQLESLEMTGNREECLSLRGERLDPRNYEAMEEIFKRVQFKTIDVEATNLDDEGSVALFDMIEYYESTENLNISSNKNMSTRGWQACARMLKKTHCLESLDAHNTGLNEQSMGLLCRTLRSGSYLTALHLENCNLSGRACTFLMTALKLNSTLRELYLAENKLSSADALQIGNLLRANTKLQLMDLRNNHIQDTGVAHIVDGLSDQSIGPGEGLQSLNLWSNQLTFHSGNHLAKALVSSQSLRCLNIGANNITNEGLFLMKDALVKNRSLQSLGLQATRVTCEGAVALAEYVADNPLIQQLDLRDNNVKVAGLLALSLSVKVNQNITKLHLDKDFKKDSKDLQEQHQQLLLEISDCCERNLKKYEERLREEEERLKLHREELQRQRQSSGSSDEPEEQLSESVCRLLSLWDQAPTPPPFPPVPCREPQSWLSSKIHVTKSNDRNRFTIRNSTSTPTIVLDPSEATSSRKSNKKSVRIDLSKPPSAVNSSLLSPPTPASPPKSRFRVSRVDADMSPSSAGSTPMPSPVPSPGNTPLPSPACTPLPSPACTPLTSPVPSPTGSPLSSPCRSPMAPASGAYYYGVIPSGATPKFTYRVGSEDSLLYRQRPRPKFVVSTYSTPESIKLASGASIHEATSPLAAQPGSYAPPPSPASLGVVSSSYLVTPSPVSPLASPCSDLSAGSEDIQLSNDDSASSLSSASWDPLGVTAPLNTPVASQSLVSSISTTQSDVSVFDDDLLDDLSNSSSTSSNSSSESVITTSGSSKCSSARVSTSSFTEVDMNVSSSSLSVATNPEPTSSSSSPIPQSSSPTSTPTTVTMENTSSNSEDLSPNNQNVVTLLSTDASSTTTLSSSMMSLQSHPDYLPVSPMSTTTADHTWEGEDDWKSTNITNSSSQPPSSSVSSPTPVLAHLPAVPSSPSSPVILSPTPTMTTTTSTKDFDNDIRLSTSDSFVSVDSGVVTPESDLANSPNAPSAPSGVLNTTGAPPPSPASSLSVFVLAQPVPNGTLAPPVSPATETKPEKSGHVAPPSSPIDPELPFSQCANTITPASQTSLTATNNNKSANPAMSPTSNSRQIRLAEPSCVLLFGGRPVRSSSPSPSTEHPAPASPTTALLSSATIDGSKEPATEALSSVSKVLGSCSSGGCEEKETAEVSSVAVSIPRAVESSPALTDFPIVAEASSISAGGPEGSAENKISVGLQTSPPTALDNWKPLLRYKSEEEEQQESSRNENYNSGNINTSNIYASNDPIAPLKLMKTTGSKRKEAILRRSSTGSFPGPSCQRSKFKTDPNRRKSMTIDDLIQIQLFELQFCGLRNNTNNNSSNNNNHNSGSSSSCKGSNERIESIGNEGFTKITTSMSSPSSISSSPTRRFIVTTVETATDLVTSPTSPPSTSTCAIPGCPLDSGHFSSDVSTQNNTYSCCSFRDSCDNGATTNNLLKSATTAATGIGEKVAITEGDNKLIVAAAATTTDRSNMSYCEKLREQESNTIGTNLVTSGDDEVVAVKKHCPPVLPTPMEAKDLPPAFGDDVTTVIAAAASAATPSAGLPHGGDITGKAEYDAATIAAVSRLCLENTDINSLVAPIASGLNLTCFLEPPSIEDTDLGIGPAISSKENVPQETLST